MKVTEAKTIAGTILRVSRSAARSTCWGKFLFNAREVSVKVSKFKSHAPITMYLRDDSWINEMKIPPDSFIGRPVSLTVHGEAYDETHGCLFIDKIEPTYQPVCLVKLDNYFDLEE